MNIKLYSRLLLLILLASCCNACEDFVEVDPPKNKLVRDEVFNRDETAESAMQGIYNELFLASFSSGGRTGVTLLAGLSADLVENMATNNLARAEFDKNEISTDNQSNLDIWSSAYNIIYMTNSFLEGLKNSDQITAELKSKLEGEARFVRAFSYFYLVNLYGEVPLVLSTDYRENRSLGRTAVSEIYEQIITDLELSSDLAASEYSSGERIQVTRFAALALLSRVYLYLEDWSKAEILSSEVINETGMFQLPDDLNEVFSANSQEAIWQISPLGGGGIVTHTNEGNLFIIDPIFSFFATTKLSASFVDNFEEDDKRLTDWISYNSGKDAFFAFKYKIRNSNEFPIREYSMVLRLAEQYLIRAETRARQGNIAGALTDLDTIRNRAGLSSLADVNPGISMQDLISEIMEQRRKELFAEWGHRWLDLKRMQMAGMILSPDNPTWEDTDVLYPIPAEERIKNPALNQNNGY